MERGESAEPTDRGRAVIPDARVVYEENVGAIHAYIARRIGRDEAADVVADVFRVAIENLRSFDPSKGQIRPWLFGIAANRLRSHRRAEQRRLRALARLDDDRVMSDGFTRAEDRMLARRDAELLLDALIELDDSDRELITLIAWEGLTYEEVAQALDIPIGTVRSRLHRARQSLRASMQSKSAEAEKKERSNRG